MLNTCIKYSNLASACTKPKEAFRLEVSDLVLLKTVQPSDSCNPIATEY